MSSLATREQLTGISLPLTYSRGADEVVNHLRMRIKMTVTGKIWISRRRSWGRGPYKGEIFSTSGCHFSPKGLPTTCCQLVECVLMSDVIIGDLNACSRETWTARGGTLEFYLFFKWTSMLCAVQEALVRKFIIRLIKKIWWDEDEFLEWVPDEKKAEVCPDEKLNWNLTQIQSSL